MSRDDKGDSTMPLSESQVVAVSDKPAVDKHDRSVWKGLVVGADEFARPPKPRRSPARWLIAGVLVAGAGGIGAYELAGSDSAPSATPAPTPTPSPAPAPVATPPGDAADSSPIDAGPPPDAPTVERSATMPAPVVPIRRRKHPPPKRHLH